MPKLSIIDPHKNEFSIKYSGFLAKYSDASRKMAHHIISNFLLFTQKNNIDFAMLNQDIINIYCDHLSKKEYAKGTYNLHISYIDQFLKHLGCKFDFKRNKVESYTNCNIVSEIGLKRIIQYLREKKDIAGNKRIKYLRDYIIFKLLFLLGLRKTELLNITHSDIKKEGDVWVYQTTGKGNKEIKKKFPDFVIKHIFNLKELEQKNDKDYIFTNFATNQYVSNKNNRLSHDALNKIINRYYSILNNDHQKITVHGIRNLSALKVFTTTNDIMKTKEHLNHSQLNTTNLYLEKVYNRDIDYYDDLNTELNTL